MQKCPRCGSNRIKRGYRPTKWWSAVIGRYNLLCNSCNWEFVGFAIPGTVPTGNRKRVKTSTQDIKFTPLESEIETEKVAENAELSETITSIENTEEFETDEGKTPSIDNVLMTEETETKPEQSAPRIKRKRRVRVKSASQ